MVTSHFLAEVSLSESVISDSGFGVKLTCCRCWLALDELSKSKTKLFGEMFLTLTEPPSYFERLYNKTIYGPQSRLIMLASNIVNKSPKNFQLKAKKIFSKIASIISDKYHDEKSKNGTHTSFIKGKLNEMQILYFQIR